MSDLIDRQEAIDAILHNQEVYSNNFGDDPIDKYTIAIIDNDAQTIAQLPSAQQWHVIKKRPMTNDEHIEWSEKVGYDIEYEDAFIYSNLPDDGEEVLVSSQYGNVYVDKFCQDEGCYFEENGDMDGIVAWMPLPEPYKE